MSSNTVYVTGLPSSATQDDVMDFFTRIGNVAEVQMPAVNSGAPVAVVFDKAEDAASAVSISGSDFQEDVPIHISAHAAPAVAVPASVNAAADAAAPVGASAEGDAPAAPHHDVDDRRADAHRRRGEDEERGQHDGENNARANPSDVTNKVMVTNIPPFTKRQPLRDLFAKCGPIDDFNLLVFRHLAYIGFATTEGFENALKMDGVEFNESKLRVERRPLGRPGAAENAVAAGSRGAESGPKTIPTRIIIRNVPKEATKENLHAFVADCGTPTDIYLRPETGIAFLAFATPEEVDRALDKSGQELLGAAVKIERREVLVCRRCGKEGHKGSECRQPYCSNCRVVGHPERECPRRRGGGGGGSRRGRGGERRRRRSSSSSSSDRDRRRRRHRSDSSDRDRRRRRHSRSRSPPRRRRHSRSRSPPRGRR